MGKSMKDALSDALKKTGSKGPVAKSGPSDSTQKQTLRKKGGQSVTHMSGKARVTLSLPRDRTRPVFQKPAAPKAVTLTAPEESTGPAVIRARPSKERAPVSTAPSKHRLSAAQAIDKTRKAQQARKAELQHLQDLARLAKAFAPKKIVQKPVSPSWTLEIEPTAVANSFLTAGPTPYGVATPQNSGIAEQMPGTKQSEDVRQLVIGLDFGTSSVKVIIGDLAAEVAYAVPFSNGQGIDRYLLPSRLWRANDRFSILGGVDAFRDLKLSLLGEGELDDHIVRAAAFLALVLRHVRGWLYTEHAESYASTRFVWKVVVGIPARSYEVDPEQPLVKGRFDLAARAAWLIAGKSIKDIDEKSARDGIERARQLLGGAVPRSESEEVEIDVVPELSAQIYGFLKSSRFDRNGFNHFMMVDVGAGTVDSSLFHVSPGKRGKWDFKFYTNNVQQLGVVNLHRTRVQWWTSALHGRGSPAPALLNVLKQAEFPTDFLGRIPELLENYVSGARLSFSSSEVHPDREFFMKKVVAQVRGATLYRARNYLDQYKLAGIPVFLCGGGVRMGFYRQLEEELKHIEGCSWLRAEARPLGVPRNLLAPGLLPEDYDRLSVAFGLSFLDVGKIVRALEQPVVKPPQRRKDDDDGYVSKDQM